MIGLKRGTVKLESYQECWKESAEEIIEVLRQVLGDTAIDIQHIGSTAIKGIHAKPIIDIVVGLKRLEDMQPFIPLLEEKEIIFRGFDQPRQLLFVKGDFAADTRTHHIHVVIWNGAEWNNYINLRDYLNANPEKAKAYDELKIVLQKEYFDDRIAYTNGKQEMIDKLLEEAREWRKNSADKILGKIVKVTVDRPMGTYHPKHKDIYYSINYGYIEGLMAPDGEEQDAYILGVNDR